MDEVNILHDIIKFFYILRILISYLFHLIPDEKITHVYHTNSLTTHLQNFSINNMNLFDVGKLEFYPMKLFFEIELIFPELKIDSDYSTSMRLMNFSMRRTAQGEVRIRARGKFKCFLGKLCE